MITTSRDFEVSLIIYKRLHTLLVSTKQWLVFHLKSKVRVLKIMSGVILEQS